MWELDQPSLRIERLEVHRRCVESRGKEMKLEETLFEKIGVEYEKKGEFLYPKLDMEDPISVVEVGRYGYMWIRLIYDEDRFMYRKFFQEGKLKEEAKKLNEEAFDYIEAFTRKYVEQQGVDPSDTIASFRLRMQAGFICQEVISSYLLEKIRSDKKVRW